VNKRGGHLISNHANADVANLTWEHLDDAVEVLAAAFVADPLMRYLFQDRSSGYRGHLNELFRFSCEVRLHLRWPLLGVMDGNRLVGIVGVSEPAEKAWPPALIEAYDRLKSHIGVSATDRLEKYSDAPKEYLPSGPYYHVGIIGVHPRAQGKGYGRVLLDSVHALSDVHPTSVGTALDTESATNVRIYERLGYRLVGSTRVDDLDIWCLFRPNATERKR
jgi:GNAT superfamily N-acetyltransferase